jgi:hypothetical protein
MGKNVFANGREISAKASANRSVAAMPDVCLSPPGPPAGPVPLPYPNSAFAKDTAGGTRSVKIGKKEVGKKNISSYSKSTGDEPATRSFGMGVITHNITGPMKFAAWSMDVKAEGANLPRFMDLTTHNHSNGGQGIGTNQGDADKDDGAGDDCEQLGKMVKDHRDAVKDSGDDKRIDESRAAGNHTCSAAVMRLDGQTQGEYHMAWSRAINNPFQKRVPVKDPLGKEVPFAKGLSKPLSKNANGEILSNLCGGGVHTYRDLNDSSAKYYHTESRILETIWAQKAKMADVAAKKMKAEIVFSIDWQFPSGTLKTPHSANAPSSSFSPSGRGSANTSCDPCSGNHDSCLGLLCHATQCMDVFICEQVASETEQVAQMDGKAARARERPTSFRKRNIADYCAQGGYV